MNAKVGDFVLDDNHRVGEIIEISRESGSGKLISATVRLGDGFKEDWQRDTFQIASFNHQIRRSNEAGTRKKQRTESPHDAVSSISHTAASMEMEMDETKEPGSNVASNKDRTRVERWIERNPNPNVDFYSEDPATLKHMATLNMVFKELHVAAQQEDADEEYSDSSNIRKKSLTFVTNIKRWWTKKCPEQPFTNFYAKLAELYFAFTKGLTKTKMENFKLFCRKYYPRISFFVSLPKIPEDRSHARKLFFFWSWPYYFDPAKQDSRDFVDCEYSGLRIHMNSKGETVNLYHEQNGGVTDIFDMNVGLSGQEYQTALKRISSETINFDTEITISTFEEFITDESPVLNQTFLSSAITHLETFDMSSLKLFDSRGEMVCQQAVYSPFFYSMMASYEHGKYKYIADQEVTDWMYLKDYKTGKERSASGRPDAAVLFQREDVLTVIEVRDRKKNYVNNIDFSKALIYTAFTAIALGEAKEVPFEDIVVPFLIGRGGFTALLFVTCLEANQEEEPVLQVYKICEVDLSNKKELREIFYKFVILLATLKGKIAFDQLSHTGWKQPKANNVFSSKKGGGRSQSKSEENSKKSEKSFTNDSRVDGSAYSRENSAKEVVKQVLVGDGDNIRYPFKRYRNVFGSIEEDYQFFQQDSPYFFESKGFFLKIWCLSDDGVDARSIDMEIDMYKRARACGVSAPLLFPLLTRMVDLDGRKYQSLVSKYISNIVRPQDYDALIRYSLSLVSNIRILHEEGKILHGDMKPMNILWDGTTLMVIDYGHAQEIKNALSWIGTEGFTAPEVMEGKACSRESDAFSVGTSM